MKNDIISFILSMDKNQWEKINCEANKLLAIVNKHNEIANDNIKIRARRINSNKCEVKKITKSP
tara:strand:+ start:1070 stop:1261 length:192 start_codon:yes stop_codon:yes gene_type:complete